MTHKLTDLLDMASKTYYEGSPIMSDEQFDYLANKAGYSKVGYTVSGSDIPHKFPMYSLDKSYGELPAHFQTVTSPVVTTPKLDGAAISLVYYEGDLVVALTRGDGKRGRPITNNVRHLVPHSIPYTSGFTQITGEVCVPKDIENARNLASGSINLKDSEEAKNRPLSFIAYGLQPYLSDCWSTDMKTLKSWGFNTVIQSNWSQFPQDGVVLRFDKYKVFEDMGYTSKHPKGAIALKQNKQGVVTKLLDVVWQVGRSGVVSPVAILEPVNIEGATVSRATLHNIEYIEALDLEIGCNVSVIRAGEIIPRVLGRV